MQSKSIIMMSIFLFININLQAGCGSCPGDVKEIRKTHEKKVKDNTLVMSVPENGEISGLVITSCGMCNLGTKEKGCSLSIKIGDKIYPVKNFGILNIEPSKNKITISIHDKNGMELNSKIIDIH